MVLPRHLRSKTYESCNAHVLVSTSIKTRVIGAESRSIVLLVSSKWRSVGVASHITDACHLSYKKLLVPIICIRGQRHTCDVRLERRRQLYCLLEMIHMWVVTPDSGQKKTFQ